MAGVSKKYTQAEKESAMILYGQDVPISDICRQLGFPYDTVFGWKTKKKPMDWDVYHKKAEDERVKVALRQIRKSAPVIIKNQLDDTQEIRTVTKEMLKKLSNGLKDNDFKLDKDTSGILRDLERTLHGIQQQQESVIGPGFNREDPGPAETKISITFDKDVSVEELKKLKAMTPAQRKKHLKVTDG